MPIEVVILDTPATQAPNGENSEPRGGHRDATVGSRHVVKAKAKSERGEREEAKEGEKKASNKSDKGEGRREQQNI